MSCAQSLSRVWLFATPWTAACQAPLSMAFSRQGHWSELPFSFSWCITDLKCSVSFPCTAKWFIHRYRYILVQILFLCTLLHDIECSSSRCTVGPCSPVSRVHAKSFESCLTQPMDWSLPGSSVPGIPWARILEWVAMSSSADLPDPGIKPTSLALAGGFFTPSATWEVMCIY